MISHAAIAKHTVLALFILCNILFAGCSSGNVNGNNETKKMVTDCPESLHQMISNSSWDSPFKKNFKAEIENIEGERIKVQLLVTATDGSDKDNTVGWIIIDRVKKTLSDITDDSENPKILKYKTEDWDRFVTCNEQNVIASEPQDPVLTLSDLFSEGSTTTFTPKDLQKDDEEIKSFKVKLTKFDQQHKNSKTLIAEDLSILINHEVFDNSNTFVHSSWLAYFLKNYHISPTDLIAIFNLAISQEDYDAIKIILDHGFIVGAKQLQLAEHTKANSVRLTKYNEENNGLDESGDPTFYNKKKSKIDDIQQLLALHYNGRD